MSLVAYGSSDEDSDGESEKTEDKIRNTDQNEPETGPSTSDISFRFQRHENTIGKSCGKKSSLSSFLPPPKFTTNKNLQTTLGESRRLGGSVLPLETKSLDPTQNLPENFAFESNSDDEEILDIEEYVPPSKSSKPEEKPKDQHDWKSVGSLFSLLPPPWKSESRVEIRAEAESKDVKSKKQPVRISIPNAPEIESDEEGDEPTSKKQKHSKVGSGLSSLLPKPKHSVTLKSNPNKPTMKLSNRPLIPHTLSKKSSVTKTLPKKENKTSKTETEGEISDEDEPTSFFSFEDKRLEKVSDSSTEIEQSIVNITAPAVVSKAQTFHCVDKSSVGSVSSSSMSSNLSSPAVVVSQNIQTLVPHTEKVKFSSGLDINYEQDLESNKPITTSSVVETYGIATGPYCDASSSETDAYYGSQTQPLEAQYQYTGYNVVDESLPSSGYSQVEEYSYGSQTQPVTEQDYIDIDKLKRLQGKRNRGEKIDIIDINAQDQVGNTDIVMTKMATEEVSHRPSKKKGDLPSSQQRRKHQITYLAHQAKEREFELRNQWATNRLTKKQTQSKYGF